MAAEGDFIDIRRDDGDQGYSVEMACGNCDWTGSMLISVGVPVPRPGLATSRCPKCGCRELRKTFDQKPRL